MKFKVSSKVKGSLILKSISRPVSAGTIVYVEGHTLYADDIQRAIKSGLLTPENPEEKIEVQENIINKTSEAVIINKTDRVVIVGGMSIRPNGSIIRDIRQLDMNAIKQSIEKGLIQVITDIDKELFESDSKKPKTKTETKPKTVEPKTELEEGIDILEENSSKEEYLDPAAELAQLVEEADKQEEVKSKAVVWDGRAQELKAAQIIPKPGQKLMYSEDDEEDADMIDALDDANEIEEDETEVITNKIENIQKKLTQKKTSKKKDIKVIKQKFSDENVAKALDSMGNPLSDEEPHMVSGWDIDEVSFVDQEQAQRSIDEAKKRDSGINIDLD